MDYSLKLSKEFTIRHYDSKDDDNLCDYDQQRLACIVSATSWVLSSTLEKEKPFVQISMKPTPVNGKIIVETGEQVTVTAPSVVDYEFIGWCYFKGLDELVKTSEFAKLENAQKEQAVGKLVQDKSLSRSYQPIADDEWVAVYKEIVNE